VLWLPKIRAAGDKDTVTPLAQAEDLHSLIPAATFTLLPGLAPSRKSKIRMRSIARSSGN